MKKNLSQILKQAFYEINNYYLQYLTAFALQSFLLAAAFLLLPPFGFILAFLVMIVTMIGLSKYSLQVLNGKQAKIEAVPSVNKNTPNHIITFIVKGFEILFFSLFLIVPGVVRALQYSQVSFVIAQNDKTSTYEALKESKKLTRNSLGKIFMLNLLYLFIALILISFTASIIIITQLFAELSITLKTVWLVTMSGFLIVATVLPFGMICNTILYQNLKETNKFNQKVSQKTFLQEVAEEFITAFSKNKPKLDEQPQSNTDDKNKSKPTKTINSTKQTASKTTNKTTNKTKTPAKNQQSKNKQTAGQKTSSSTKSKKS